MYLHQNDTYTTHLSSTTELLISYVDFQFGKGQHIISFTEVGIASRASIRIQAHETTTPHASEEPPMVAWGSLHHSSWSASTSSLMSCALWGRLRSRLPGMSHKCSIGDRSGDFAGRGTVLILRNCTWSWTTTRARLAVVSSSWKMNAFPCGRA